MVEADIKLTEEKFKVAKVKFNGCLTSLWGQDNKVELFGLGRLADIKAWPASEWHPGWPVMYCRHAYKSKDNFTLHKALLLLEDVFLVTKDDETVRATLSSVQGAETSGGIRSINMGTKYRSGNTMHLEGESKEKKGWGFQH
jgi:hypothetical protein